MRLTSQHIRDQLVLLGVPEGTRVAVGVSGGADSLALMLLAQDHFRVSALTVDHGLRSGAADEAQLVADVCQRHSIDHETLLWTGDKPVANIQAEARQARYDLMAGWCQDKGIQFLLTAHHMDDQAETVLLRLARGSGVYGLAGMAAVRDLDGVTLLRPLLTVPKSELTAYLQAMGVSWAEDPSNQSDAYDRVKIRRMLANPPVEGLRADRLAATASRLRRSRDALEHYEALWLGRAVEAHGDQGYVFLKADTLTGEPEEILLRGLASLCRFVGKGMYVPRMEKLQRLYRQITQEGFRGQTLYGAQFSANCDGKILISREVGDCEAGTCLKETVTWDNRFEICAKGDIAGLEISALGEDGWRQLKASAFDLEHLLIPIKAVWALPAIFKGTDLWCVPHLDYTIDKEIQVTARSIRKLVTKK